MIMIMIRVVRREIETLRYLDPISATDYQIWDNDNSDLNAVLNHSNTPGIICCDEDVDRLSKLDVV